VTPGRSRCLRPSAFTPSSEIDQLSVRFDVPRPSRLRETGTEPVPRTMCGVSADSKTRTRPIVTPSRSTFVGGEGREWLDLGA